MRRCLWRRKSPSKSEGGIKINFVKCPGGVKPAPKAKAKEEEDSSDDDDSDDLESCDSGDDE